MMDIKQRVAPFWTPGKPVTTKTGTRLSIGCDDVPVPDCPACGGELQPFGYRDLTLIDVPEQPGHRFDLKIKRPRYKCRSCGKFHVIDYPLRAPGARHTQAFRTMCLELLEQGQTLRAIGEQLGVSFATVRDIAAG